MIYWILGGAVVLILSVYNLLKDLFLFHVEKFPQGPLSLPIVGNVHLLNPKTPHFSLEKMVKKYGSIFSLRMGHVGRMVFLHDIHHINQVFECPYAHNRPDLPIFAKINKGADGIGSCAYDQRWKIMTKALHKGLAKVSNKSLQSVSMHAYSQLFERFDKADTTKSWYSPRMDLTMACSAIFGPFVYGIEPESLDSEELLQRRRYHSVMMTVLNPSHPFNLIPALWNLPLPLKKKLAICFQERDELFDRSFENRTQNFTGEIEDVLDIIADFEQKRQTSDVTNVSKRDMFLSAWALYLAGCDTLTDTTLWTMLYLCIHTEVQDKMQQEIDNLIPDGDVNILDLKPQLHYTRAAILEGIRMSSPVAIGIPHELTEDIYIDNYTLPKGTIVMPNQWHVHHNSEYWPEPFDFKPERFLDENGELLPTYYIFQKMPYIPFSRGKRPCLGQHLALDLLLVYFASLLKKMTMRLPKGYTPNLNGYVVFNLRPNDFPVEFTPRDQTT